MTFSHQFQHLPPPPSSLRALSHPHLARLLNVNLEPVSHPPCPVHPTASSQRTWGLTPSSASCLTIDWVSLTGCRNTLCISFTPLGIVLRVFDYLSFYPLHLRHPSHSPPVIPLIFPTTPTMAPATASGNANTPVQRARDDLEAT